jgi:hypothetical protein
MDPTPLQVAIHQYHWSRTPEETLAAIAAVLRADMNAMGAQKTISPAYHAHLMRLGYERAIATVEAIQ